MKVDCGNQIRVCVGTGGAKWTFKALVVGDYAVSFDFSIVRRAVDSKLENVTGELCFQGGGTPAYLLKFTEDGEIQTWKGTPLCTYGETPRHIIVAYSVEKRRFNVYIDGRQKVTDYMAEDPGSIPVNCDKVESFFVNFQAVEESAEIELDRVMAYHYDAKQEGVPVYDPSYEPVPEEKQILLTEQTTIPSEEPQRKWLEGAVSLHMRSGLLYVGGEKVLLEDLPYYLGEEYMVPGQMLECGFGLRVSVEEDEIQIGERLRSGETLDLMVGSKEMTVKGQRVQLKEAPEYRQGVLYLPLAGIAEAGLGKKITVDQTTVHNGMVLIGETELVLPEGEALQELNDFCFFFRPQKERILEDYRKSPVSGVHPRVLANGEDFARLRKEVQENPVKKGWMKDLLAHCEEIMKKPVLKYELRDGVRLLYVAWDCTDYMMHLALAYQLTGDRKYFDAAWPHLEAVAQMPDWNPSHHIDVGSMAYGYAIAYDWFYDIMTPTQRQLVEKGVYNNAFWILNLAMADPDTAYTSVWMKNNHNVYSNAGMIACCMAFMDVYPEIGAKLTADVLRVLECYMDKFAPDGSYYEGPSYAEVAIDFSTRLLAALHSVMGTMYRIEQSHGYSRLAEYMTNMQSDVSSFNFADSGMGIVTASGLFWLYEIFGITGIKDMVAISWFQKMDSEAIPLPFCLLWYNVKEEHSDLQAALDVHYPGKEIISMRNGFGPGQVFVGIKAGETLYAHSHLDAGSFVYDAMGKRWAYDFGSDDYNLYYKYYVWDIFRLRVEAHNTLLINPDLSPGYELGARADVLSYESGRQGVITKIDMTQLYGPRVNSARRGYFYTDDRQSLVVRDEVDFPKESEAYWLMYIDAEAQIQGNEVLLTDKEDPEKQLKVEFTSSVPGVAVVEAAEPFATSPQIPGQMRNDGFYRLYYKITAQGKATITAKLTPVTAFASASALGEYDKNMDQWTL